MGSANERRRYYVTSPLIGRAHTQNDPCIMMVSIEGLSHFHIPNAMLRNTMGTMRPCKIQVFADFTTSMKSKNWKKNIYVNFVGVGIGLEYFIMICRFIYHLPHYNVQLVGCWYTPWCQDMGTLSALLAICEGNPSVTVVPTTDTQSSDVGVAVILNELLKKQSSWRWFETH